MRRITVTGATGLIGTKLVAALQERGDEVTVLSRRPQAAKRALGVDAVGWQPESDPAPVDALAPRCQVRTRSRRSPARGRGLLLGVP